MKIPLIKPDLPPFSKIKNELKEIFASGRVSNFGKHMQKFEKKAGEYIGAYAACVSSGTAGLILALQALGVGKTDRKKVILPSFTFTATAQAVLYAGAIPIFAEVEEDFNLSITDLEYLLNKHKDVVCVLPVHAFGLPAKTKDIEEVVNAAAKRGKKHIGVIYDAAHAFGSSIRGVRVGVFGKAEVFSFSVTKLLVSIEGGMVTSKDRRFIEQIAKMRNYGIRQNYNACFPGLNSKMSEIHALVGLYNLKRIEQLLKERHRKAAYYVKKLSRLKNFKPPPLYDGITQTFKDFTLLISEDKIKKRDIVREFLERKGVETRAYFYPPVHQQDFFKRFSDRKLSFTEKLSQRVITLPFYASITELEMNYVVDALKEAERKIL